MSTPSFTRYRTGKLSVPSTTTSHGSKISKAFSLDKIVSYVTTSTFGLIRSSVSRADSTFGRPTSSVPCEIWRWRFDRSTRSKSTSPIVPTPAAARYIAIGEPSPPVPMHSTFASSSLRCPSAPTPGRMMWRA